ncbi:MAG: hypothetical protein R6W98_10085, partial [Oceanibaculum nanhaiense]
IFLIFYLFFRAVALCDGYISNGFLRISVKNIWWFSMPISQIGEVIFKLNDMATTVASAVEQQTAATNEISRNADEAARGTAEVTENITGVNEAAGSTSSGASQVLSAAQSLAQRAESMRRTVDSFLDEVKAA